MKVLGVDPGIERTGYAILEYNLNNYLPHSYGIITTSKNIDKSKRIQTIFDDLQNLLNKYNPDFIVVESLIFYKNVKTALVVSEVRGVIFLLSAINNIPLYEYTPLQVKTAVTGYGRASKKQIENAIRIILNLNEIPKPDDVSDALAISICGINHLLMKRLLE